MSEVISVSKKVQSQHLSNEILHPVEKKICFFKDVIQKTIIHVQKNKNLDIFR